MPKPSGGALALLAAFATLGAVTALDAVAAETGGTDACETRGEACRPGDESLHLLQRRGSMLTGLAADHHSACKEKVLCNPKSVVFKLGLKTSGAVEGSEIAFAQTIMQKLHEFLLQSNASVEPALSAEGLEKEPARFVEFLDTPPPQFALRSDGWIVRHRWPVPGAMGGSAEEGRRHRRRSFAADEDLCIKRRSKEDPKHHPEDADRLLTAEGVMAKYKAKEQWIAGAERPAFQLYSCFKGVLFNSLAVSGFDLSAQQTTQEWSQLLPALGQAGSGDEPIGPNGLKIQQEEVPLAAKHFVDADGQTFKFEPSVILWFDQADVQPRTAFTGELTWDMKIHKHRHHEAERARLAIFEPLVAFLQSQGLVEDGSKTVQAYARMRGPVSNTTATA